MIMYTFSGSFLQVEGHKKAVHRSRCIFLLCSSPATASGVVLPLSGQSFSGSATVSGWGVTSEDALEGSAVLMVATVPIVSDEGKEI